MAPAVRLLAGQGDRCRSASSQVRAVGRCARDARHRWSAIARWGHHVTRDRCARILATLVIVAITNCAATAQKVRSVPPPPRIGQLELVQPFTLTYRAVVKWSDGHTYFRTTARLTLSYDRKSLLYRSEDTSTGVTRTVLYDGHDTYTADSNSKMGEIDPGFNLDRMLYCPMPGVGIPGAPLLQSGLYAGIAPQIVKQIAPKVGSEPRFVDPVLYGTPGQERDYGAYVWADVDSRARMGSSLGSVVTVLSSGVPKVLWFDTFENIGPCPGTLWEFYSHERFEGVWLAKRIRMRVYAALKEGGQNTLLRDARYDLESAVAGPLKPAAYDPATYLPRHANITDTTGKSTRAFIYEPNLGPLQVQRGKGLDISKWAGVHAKTPANTGAIGLVVLIVISVVWIVLRRKYLR